MINHRGSNTRFLLAVVALVAAPLPADEQPPPGFSAIADQRQLFPDDQGVASIENRE